MADIFPSHFKFDMHITYHGEFVRALVDMSDAQLKALDVMAKRERRSRASLIRAAIDDYLAGRQRKQVSDGFGLWGERRIDGLAYQDAMRSEW